MLKRVEAVCKTAQAKYFLRFIMDGLVVAAEDGHCLQKFERYIFCLSY
jgi:hypothetical protein